MTDEHEGQGGEGARKRGRLGKVMIALAIGSVGCCAAGLIGGGVMLSDQQVSAEVDPSQQDRLLTRAKVRAALTPQPPATDDAAYESWATVVRPAQHVMLQYDYAREDDPQGVTAIHSVVYITEGAEEAATLLKLQSAMLPAMLKGVSEAGLKLHPRDVSAQVKLGDAVTLAVLEDPQGAPRGNMLLARSGKVVITLIIEGAGWAERADPKRPTYTPAMLDAYAAQLKAASRAYP